MLKLRLTTSISEEKFAAFPAKLIMSNLLSNSVKGAISMVLILFSFQLGRCEDAARTSIFDDNWLKTVVSIEVREMKGTQSVARAIGTGFLIGTTNNHLALVTASHVIAPPPNRIFRTNLVYRLNNRQKQSDLQSDQDLAKLTGGWSIDFTNDVACRLIGWGKESDLKFIPVSRMLSRKSLQAGTPVLILGFPMGLRSEGYATPITRKGVISRASDGEDLLADALIFPGNSGGPVVYVPVIRLSLDFSSGLLDHQALAGMVIEYLTYTDIAISPQTQRTRVAFEENSGLCKLVPADAILDLLQRPDFSQRDKELK